MDTQRQVNSTSAKFPALLIPEMFTSSRRATWIPMGPFSGSAVEISGRIVSTPSGERSTSQQGGGSTPAGHFCSVPMIHPRRCSTMESGELKSLLETMPVRSQNNCGALNASEAEIKSAARRRVRKSRGEQPSPRHNKTAHRNTFQVRMKYELWLREDSNQLRLSAGQKRRGCNLTLEFLRPAAGDLLVASGAVAICGYFIFSDGISVALDRKF